MAKIDSLEIELKTNAKEVVKDIDTLSKSVEKLSKIDTKSLYQNLNSISRVIKNFANDIKALDTSKLESMANSISKISGSTQKSMQQASKSVSELNKNMANTSGVKKNKQSVDEFMASIKGLGKNRNFFGSGSQLDSEIASTKNKIEKVRTALEAYNQEGKSVETKGWRTAQRQLEEYTNYLNTLIEKQRIASSTAKGFQFDEKAIAGSKENIYKLLLSDEQYNKMRESILAKQPIEIPATVNADKIKQTIKNSVSNIPPIDTKGIDGVTEQVKKAEKTVQDAGMKMRSALMFEPTKLGQGQKYTEEYKALEKEILKAEKELERYLNTQEKLDNIGVKQDSQRYKNIQVNIDQTDAKLQKLYQDMKMLQSEGGDIINPNSFDRLSEKSSKAQSVMQSLTKALRAGGFGSAASGVQKLSADVGALSNGLAGAGASAEGAGAAMTGLQTAIPVIGIILAAVTLLIKAFTSLARAVINAVKKIGNGIKSIVVGFKNLVSNILSIGTSSYQAHTAVGKFLNRVINMFKSRVLRQAITKAIEYAKQGFKDLDAYSANIGTPFHNNVQTIVADLKWLGRSIAAAFEPIINVATPILDFLIDKIVTVINYINQFFAVLSGSSTWTKATKGASGYEEATGGAAKAQKDLNKQIREWDKLNVITDPNKNKGGGGSGGASGDGGGFTTEEVSNNIKNLAKKFKETWENGADFTWLGTDLGNKLAEALDKIPWNNIKKSASKLGKALATTINGFVEVPGLPEKLGHSIAEGINTLLSGFEGFVGNIHGDSIGTFIGNLVKTALADIEWDKYITSMGKLGEELAKAVNALASTDVLSEISKSFAKLLKGAIEGAYKFVTNIKWDELGTKIGESISEFFKTLNEVDENGMSGFEKIGATIKNLKDGLQSLFTNAFESIDKEEVKTAVGNFLKGLIDPEEAKDWLKDKLQQSFVKALTGGVINLGILKFSFDAGQSIGEKAQEGWNKAVEWLKDKYLTFKANLPTADEMKEKIATFITNIKEKLAATISIAFPSWEKISKKIKSTINNLKKAFKISFELKVPSWSSIKSKFDAIVNGIKSLFKLDLKFNTNASSQSVGTSVTGSAVTKAVTNAVKKITKKTKKKADGGIYSNGTWKKFKVGGFPSHGTQFIAGEHGAEVVGHINGQTEVLNKSQIAQAMMGAVANGNAEQNALLRQQNEYLRQLLMKDSSISYRDVFKATQKGASEYKTMTGNPAFI